MSEIPAPLQYIIKTCSQAASRGTALDNLNDYFVKARLAVQSKKTGFERFSWGIVWSERVCELLGQLNVELDSQQVILRDLEGAFESGDFYAVDKGGRDLKYSVEETAKLEETLMSTVSRQAVVSSYPVFDKLIKAGQNVLKQNISPKVLSAFMVPAVNFTVRLRAAVKRFGLFYGESSLWECAGKVVSSIEAGMGAFDRFLRTGQEKCLKDGIDILTTSTVTMFTVVTDMGIWAENERRYAKHYLTEELFRAREYGLDGEDLKALWLAVESSLQLELSQVQTLVNHPLGTLCGVHKKELVAVLNLVNATIRHGLENGLEALDLAGFDKLLVNLDKLIQNDLTKVNIEFRMAAGAPNFEELLIAVGLAVDDKIDIEAFRVILRGVADNVAEVAAGLNNNAGSLDPEQWSQLSVCVDAQLQGCQALDAACASHDVEGMRKAWHLIAGTLPSTVRLSKEMKEGLGVEESSSSRTVTCMRCGQVNSQQDRYCSRCSAVLMQLAQAPIEYTDMESGEVVNGGSVNLPRNIMKLEQVIRSVEEGSAYTDEIASVVGGLLESAYSYRNMYLNKVRRALIDDGMDSSLIERFEADMDTYIEGLELCMEFVQNPSMDTLYRGYEQASGGAIDLADIQDEIASYF